MFLSQFFFTPVCIDFYKKKAIAEIYQIDRRINMCITTS